MKQHLSIILASALTFAGASAAFAGSMSQNNAATGMERGDTSNAMKRNDRMEHATTGSTAPQGRLTLSDAQKQKLWGDLSSNAQRQTPPASFSGNVGEVVPNNVNTKPLPSQATNEVPVIRNYNYAMLNDRIVLVNPRTNKVAGVIRQQ
ncbi:hypothetical protein DNX69_23515 [Rhodopseudomonas palustris]|uniref:DUF1236 domain-containing protein n=1 Tax=Rhodopseudomonas palustris TaxID=1076 RepID=A0A323U9R9_RHOPL|nr:DUF1236 domain-containing protein [Rhodopseudomonas palustris]PZA09515.1 hypothetical protein DNX69_23515 [Rhodopseudomonas palustris]